MKRALSIIIALFMLFGCFSAFAVPEREEITLVEVTDVRTEPNAGDRVVEYLNWHTPTDANYVVQDVMWYNTERDVLLGNNDVFEAGVRYQLSILVFPKTGYIFTENTVFILNGGIEYSSDSYMEKDGFGFWMKTIPTLAVEKTVSGDANEDGKINTADAAAILRHAAGIAQLSGEGLTAADTNRDGKANTADAVLVLRYAAGMITSFDEKPSEPEPDYTLSFRSLAEYREFCAAGELSDSEFMAFMQSHDYYMNGITSKAKHKAVCDEINAAPLPVADGLELRYLIFHTAWHELNVQYYGKGEDGCSFSINTDSEIMLDEYLANVRSKENVEKVELNNDCITEAYYVTEHEYDFEAYYAVIDGYFMLYRAYRCTAEEARALLESVAVTAFAA